MTKKGFFSSLFKSADQDEEEQHQKEFALNKEKEENESGSFTEEREALPPVDPEAEQFIKEKLETILSLAGFQAVVVARPDKPGIIFLDITDTDEMGAVIGREGNTIESLQVLLKAFLYKKYGKQVPLIVDAGNYRKKRLEKAKSHAIRASKDINEQYPRKELEPMSAAERRVIHMIFKEHNRLKSYSVGEGANRRIVIEQR